MEEISAILRGRGEKIVSDNKCIRTSKEGRGVNFLFPPWGWLDVFWNDPFQQNDNIIITCCKHTLLQRSEIFICVCSLQFLTETLQWHDFKLQPLLSTLELFLR